MPISPSAGVKDSTSSMPPGSGEAISSTTEEGVSLVAGILPVVLMNAHEDTLIMSAAISVERIAIG